MNNFEQALGKYLPMLTIVFNLKNILSNLKKVKIGTTHKVHVITRAEKYCLTKFTYENLNNILEVRKKAFACKKSGLAL